MIGYCGFTKVGLLAPVLMENGSAKSRRQGRENLTEGTLLHNIFSFLARLPS